ncbi:winged helix-turn-helix transcriptional regulator [Amphibacillus sp. Q70]|uniref:winged helix-turn-helix transcriptional regulator n=1 Tax=Amphibacillus sp. Q70 TaxID=3453416 RepID=UPI003F85B32B
MYEHKIKKEYRCPLEYGLEMIEGKWKSRIVIMLSQKDVLRYNEIKDEMLDITDSVLSNTLRELVNDEMIERIQYNEIPVRVEYSLAKKGETLVPILESICSWSQNYIKEDLIVNNICSGDH